MTGSKIESRIRALEDRSKGAASPAAFVLWAHTPDALQSRHAYELAAGCVRQGDPVIMGLMPIGSPLPPARWTVLDGITDGELAALAGTGEARRPAYASTASDADLFRALTRPGP